MIVLKGWFDESGTDPHPDINVGSFAGYIASVDTWNRFEGLWGQVLADYDVPYFHGREFGPSIGPFKKWKNDEQKRRCFINSLTEAVAYSGDDISGVGSGVFLDDLQRFNQERSQSLEPYSFCMSACFMEIFNRIWQRDERVEAVCDTTDRPYLRIDKAFGYLHHDPFYHQCEKHIVMVPLCEGFSFKNVFQIQLADFAAWELRQNNERVRTWYKTTTGEEDRTLLNWFTWIHSQPKKPTHWSGERKSLVSLLGAAPIQGFIWDYDAIVRADAARARIWSR
jgi:hypothetical protein